MEVLGVKVTNVSKKELFNKFEDYFTTRSNHIVISLNAEAITQSLSSSSFKEIINTSTDSLPDSFGILFATKYYKEVSKLNLPTFIKPFAFFVIGTKIGLLGFLNVAYLKSEGDLIVGSDLPSELSEHFSSIDKPLSVYFIGTKYQNGVENAKEALNILEKRYPKVNFVGSAFLREETESGFQFVNNDKLLEKIRSDVKSKGLENVDFCFVCSRQVLSEKWIFNNLNNLPFKVTMNVGAAFDFITGRQKRAPKMFRNLKLEWLFRMLSGFDIKRIKRVLWAFPVFPILVYLDSLKK